MATKKTTQDITEQIRQLIAEDTAASPLRAVPLGKLYRALQAKRGGVTLGQFHDALRDLAALGSIRLSPWTGAMYQLQDQECCLILGREIVAYANAEIEAKMRTAGWGRRFSGVPAAALAMAHRHCTPFLRSREGE